MHLFVCSYVCVVYITPIFVCVSIKVKGILLDFGEFSPPRFPVLEQAEILPSLGTLDPRERKKDLIWMLISNSGIQDMGLGTVGRFGWFHTSKP